MSVLPTFLRAARTRMSVEDVVVDSVSPPINDGSLAAPSVILARRIELCPPRHYPERLDFLYDAEVDREVDREEHHPYR